MLLEEKLPSELCCCGCCRILAGENPALVKASVLLPSTNLIFEKLSPSNGPAVVQWSRWRCCHPNLSCIVSSVHFLIPYVRRQLNAKPESTLISELPKHCVKLQLWHREVKELDVFHVYRKYSLLYFWRSKIQSFLLSVRGGKSTKSHCWKPNPS